MADVEIQAQEVLLRDANGNPIVPVVGNTLPDMNTGTKDKFLTNDGEDAYWDNVPPATEVTYTDGTTATLEDVVYQTQSTYANRTTFPKTQMDVVENIGDTNNPLYFYNVKSISANTSYTFNGNGTFCTTSASIATVTISKNSNTAVVYGTYIRVPRGCTFTTTVAGRFYFDDNYYGYSAS